MKTRRRLFAIMLVLTLALGSMLAQPIIAQASSPITVTVDGRQVAFPDQEPIIVDSRVLVPVRGVFEEMGFEVDWDEEARAAVLTSDDFLVIIPQGEASFTVNGVTHTPDVPQRIVNNRFLLPLRAVAEAVGGEADWDGAASVAMIFTNGSAAEPDDEPGPADDTGESDDGLATLITTFDNIAVVITPLNPSTESFEWEDNLGLYVLIAAGLPGMAFPIDDRISEFESLPTFNLSVSAPSTLSVFVQDADGALTNLPLHEHADYLFMAVYRINNNFTGFTSTPLMAQPPELVVLHPAGGFNLAQEGISNSVLFGSISLIGHEFIIVVYLDADGPGTAIAHLVIER